MVANEDKFGIGLAHAMDCWFAGYLMVHSSRELAMTFEWSAEGFLKLRCKALANATFVDDARILAIVGRAAGYSRIARAGGSALAVDMDERARLHGCACGWAGRPGACRWWLHDKTHCWAACCGKLKTPPRRRALHGSEKDNSTNFLTGIRHTLRNAAKGRNASRYNSHVHVPSMPSSSRPDAASLAALRAMSDADYCAHVNRATAPLFVRLPKRGTALTQPNAGLDLLYRARWQREMHAQRVAMRSPAACFIAAPWHDIVEIEWRVHKMTDKLQMIAALWLYGLDWRRRHFVALNQCSRAQLNEAVADAIARTSGHSTSFNVLHVNLTLFESRLEGLAAAATFGHPPQPRNVVPIPLFHANWARDQSLMSSSCGAARRAGRLRSYGLVFRGSCVKVVHDGRRQLISALNAGTNATFGAAAPINVSCVKESFTAFSSLVCNSAWTLVPSGSFPPTFMLYEAMLGGSLPLFAYFTSWGGARFSTDPDTPAIRTITSRITLERLARPLVPLNSMQIDALMPFYDEGVRFSEFGAALLAPDSAAVMRIVNNNSELHIKQRRLRAILPLFTPNGTFAYMLRRMHREAGTRLHDFLPAAGSVSTWVPALEQVTPIHAPIIKNIAHRNCSCKWAVGKYRGVAGGRCSPHRNDHTLCWATCCARPA